MANDGLVGLALPAPASSSNQSDTLVVRVEEVKPSGCCFGPVSPRRRKKAPPRAHKPGAASAKYDAAAVETVALCDVNAAALSALIAKLVVAVHPSDRWAALDGAQLDSVDAVTEWRQHCRRLRVLSGRLADKESSHGKLMSIRPHSVKPHEVKAYQGLYQSMMRLRTDATALKQQVATAQQVRPRGTRRALCCTRHGALPLPLL